MERARMVLLVTLGHPFHARVVAARLGAEGIPVELRGNVDGPYPVGEVHLYVSESDLDDARAVLLADEVEAAMEGDADEPDGRAPAALWVVVAAMVLVAVLTVTRHV